MQQGEKKSGSDSRSVSSSNSDVNSEVLLNRIFKPKIKNKGGLPKRKSNGNLLSLVQQEFESDNNKSDKARKILDKNATNKLLSKQRLKKRAISREEVTIKPVVEPTGYQATIEVIEENISEANLLNSFDD